MPTFKSPLPPVNIPEVDLYSFFFDRVPAPPANKRCLIDGATGDVITYGQLKTRVDHVASGLYHACGIREYDVVGIFSPNHIEYPLAIFAAHKLGACVTTANPTYTVDELRFQLVDAAPRVLFTLPDLLQAALQAAKGTKVEKIFVFGPEGAQAHGVKTLRDLETGGFPHVEKAQIKDVRKRTCFLCYSSGTTGRPKGVESTHHNIVSNVMQISGAETDTRPEDVWMCVLPLYHCFALVVVLCFGLFRGISIVVQPKFDLEQFLKIVQTYKVTMAHLVPPIIIGLAKHPIVDKYDLSSLRDIFSGAAPLGRELQEETSKRLKTFVRQGYGMTELSPVSHMPVSDPAKFVPGSIGYLIANQEAKLVDPITGKELGVDEEGELWIKGPNVMKGYLNRPDATAETIDKDGFLHTGDVAKVDKNGHFYITDRLKELIKVKGLQVAPAELEALLLVHPAVADTAVIGIPDERAGEAPKAFVVLKPGQKANKETADQIIGYLDSKLAPHKRLRGGVQFIEAIPKSPSGKILRRLLKDLEKQQSSTPSSKL